MAGATLLTVLTAASAAASAYTTVSAGRAKKEAAIFEAEQLRENAEMAKLDAANANLKRLEEFDQIRRTNIAISAANGALPRSSRSFLAIQQRGKDVFLRDKALITLGGKNRVSQLQGSANQTLDTGRQAFRSSIIKAGGTLISGGMDIQEIKDREED